MSADRNKATDRGPVPVVTPEKNKPKTLAQNRQTDTHGVKYTLDPDKGTLIDDLVHKPGETIITQSLEDPERTNYYYLEEQIGKGGLATVFRAKKMGADKPIALKLIAPEQKVLDNPEELEDVRNLFLFQADTEKRLRQGGVSCVELHDSGLVAPRKRAVGLEYELLEGGYTVEEFIDYHKKRGLVIPSKVAACIAVQIAESLNQAGHLRPPIHHLDLSDDNIYIYPNGKVKPLDWANYAGILGKPGFAAPGVAKEALNHLKNPSEKEDPEKRDIFGLGMITRTMIVGDNPLDPKQEYADPRSLKDQETEKKEQPKPQGLYQTIRSWFDRLKKDQTSASDKEEQAKKKKEQAEQKKQAERKRKFWQRIDESRVSDLKSLSNICRDISPELSNIVSESTNPSLERIRQNRPYTLEELYQDYLESSGCGSTKEAARVVGSYLQLITNGHDFDDVITEDKKHLQAERDLFDIAKDTWQNLGAISANPQYWKCVTTFADRFGESNVKDAEKKFVAEGYDERFNPLISSIETITRQRNNFQQRKQQLEQKQKELQASLKDRIKHRISLAWKRYRYRNNPDKRPIPIRVQLEVLPSRILSSQRVITALEQERTELDNELSAKEREIDDTPYEKFRREYGGKKTPGNYLRIYEILMQDEVKQFKQGAQKVRDERRREHESRTTGKYTLVRGPNIGKRKGFKTIAEVDHSPNSGRNGSHAYR